MAIFCSPVQAEDQVFKLPWRTKLLETPEASIQIVWRVPTASSWANVSVDAGQGWWTEQRDPSKIGVTFTGNSTSYRLNFTIKWNDVINQTVRIIIQSAGEEVDDMAIPIAARSLLIEFAKVQTHPKKTYPTADEIAQANERARETKDRIVINSVTSAATSVEEAKWVIVYSGIGTVGSVFLLTVFSDEVKNYVKKRMSRGPGFG